MLSRCLVVALMCLLEGCAWRGWGSAPTGGGVVLMPGDPAPPVAAAPSPPDPRGPSLESEQRRLADLFRGTPVSFVMQGDGSLRVSVPLRFAFDKGRSAVKAPLGAVLDRLAKSQRDRGTLIVVAAPGDARVKGAMLANARAASARDYMVGLGVDARRLTLAPPALAASAVLLVITDTAPRCAPGACASQLGLEAVN